MNDLHFVGDDLEAGVLGSILRGPLALTEAAADRDVLATSEIADGFSHRTERNDIDVEGTSRFAVPITSGHGKLKRAHLEAGSGLSVCRVRHLRPHLKME